VRVCTPENDSFSLQCSVLQCVAVCCSVNAADASDKITGLFCIILSLLKGSFAKETYNFIDPTVCMQQTRGVSRAGLQY